MLANIGLVGPNYSVKMNFSGLNQILSYPHILMLIKKYGHCVQVAWQRLLALCTGVGTYSIALIVTAFMAGLVFAIAIVMPITVPRMVASKTPNTATRSVLRMPTR